MASSVSLNNVMHIYFLYSALLALKLLALKPLASVVTCDEQKIQRANLSDLKNLTPFWLVSGLYITTQPLLTTVRTLFRFYFAMRCIAAIGYVHKIPRCMNEMAFYVSFGITAYMAACVVYEYRGSF